MKEPEFVGPTKGIAVIKGWSYRKEVLFGSVYGHPDWKDGSYVSAGAVIDVVKDAEDTYIVETNDMFYALVPPADKDRPFRFEKKATTTSED